MLSLKEIELAVEKVLPKNKTDAIYVFGSFNTEFFDEDSDIDIGWFCKDTVDYDEIYKLEEELKKELGKNIDLIQASTINTPLFLLGNILGGKPIGYMSKKFENWFDTNIEDIQWKSQDILRIVTDLDFNY